MRWLVGLGLLVNIACVVDVIPVTAEHDFLCYVDSDCASNYMCFYLPSGDGVCLLPCESDSECPDAFFCGEAIDYSYYCFPESLLYSYE